MLQMVRTLAQFTIALEDMRDIGDGIDAAFAASGLGGAAEELPEKGCGSRGGTEVMRKGIGGNRVGGSWTGRWGGIVWWDGGNIWEGGAWMRHVWTRVYPAEPGTCGVWTAIAVATAPPSSSSACRPRGSPDRREGEGGGGEQCSHPERVMEGMGGGREPSLPPPPSADLHRGGIGWWGNAPIPIAVGG